MTESPAPIQPTQADPPASSARKGRSILIVLALLMTAGSLLATLAGLAARWHWMLDLASHWRVQIALGSLLPLALLLARKRWLLALAPAGVAGYHLAFILPLYLPPPSRPTDGRPFLAMLTNVHTGNRDAGRLLKLIKQESPEVIALLEINRWWQEQLSPLREHYPHQVAIPREDNFGIALLSKWPIESQQVVYIGQADVPTIIATLTPASSPMRPVKVIVTHPLPPVSAEYAAMRDEQLRLLARDHLPLWRDSRPDAPSAILLMGDLNATSWSPVFGDLLRESKLRDTRQGFGVQPTWPAGGGLMRIPLDHILTSANLVIYNRWTGPNIGSDHLPVFVRLSRQAPPRMPRKLPERRE